MAARWIVGIDEAGYGPNLGPFVMSAVACRVEEEGPACLWERLTATVRRHGGRKRKDPRLVIDDSKLVHGGKGIAGLERGIAALLGGLPATLAGLARVLCPADQDELAAESWFTGTTALPSSGEEMPPVQALRAEGVFGWTAASAVVCAPRFNRVAERAGTKSAVLADSFVRLLEEMTHRCGEDDLEVVGDKQGGRNTYALQVQQATGVLVRVVEEGEQRSRYEADLHGRKLSVTFVPRADSEQMCVALASMASKYLRELFMAEFNHFWQGLVPGLAPTAGYPGDAPRYLESIRPAAQALKVPTESIWRSR